MACNGNLIVGGIYFAFDIRREDIAVGQTAREVQGVNKNTRGDSDAYIVIQLRGFWGKGNVQQTTARRIPVRRSDGKELGILTPSVIQIGIADVLRECGTRNRNSPDERLAHFYFTEIVPTVRNDRHRRIQLASECSCRAFVLLAFIFGHDTPMISRAMCQATDLIGMRGDVGRHRRIRFTTFALPEVKVIAVSIGDGIPIEIHVGVAVNVVIGWTHVGEVTQGTDRKDGQMQRKGTITAVNGLILP